MGLGAIVVSGNVQRDICLIDFRRHIQEKKLPIDAEQEMRRAERMGIGGYHSAGGGHYQITSIRVPTRPNTYLVSWQFDGKDYKWEVESDERQGFVEHLGVEPTFAALRAVESGAMKGSSAQNDRLAYAAIRTGDEICAIVVDRSDPDKSEFYRWRMERPQDGGVS